MQVSVELSQIVDAASYDDMMRLPRLVAVRLDDLDRFIRDNPLLPTESAPAYARRMRVNGRWPLRFLINCHARYHDLHATQTVSRAFVDRDTVPRSDRNRVPEPGHGGEDDVLPIRVLKDGQPFARFADIEDCWDCVAAMPGKFEVYNRAELVFRWEHS